MTVPPFPPLAPREGDLERVRRAARVRRARVPAAVGGTAVAVVVALVALTGGGPDRVALVTSTPTPDVTETASPLPVATPRLTPTASSSPKPNVEVSMTEVPSPTASRPTDISTPSPTADPTVPAPKWDQACENGKARYLYEGRAVDTAGRPVANAVITGVKCVGGAQEAFGVTGRTDSDGHFSVPCNDSLVSFGNFAYKDGDGHTFPDAPDIGLAFLHGYDNQLPGNPGPGDCRSDWTVVMPPSSGLDVTVYDSNGNKQSYPVQVFPLPDDVNWIKDVQPDTDGVDRFRGLAPVQYELVFGSFDRSCKVTLKGGPNQPLTVVFHASDTSISCVVGGAPPTPAPTPSPTPSSSPTP